MSYDITRTELVWPGKYDEKGKRVAPPRVSLPFQVIERVNESRATREIKKTQALTLFDAYESDGAETFEDGWRNKLIWGDNELVMSSLLDQFAGKVDLIYIDPPFATGADFGMSVPIGESGEIFKEQSAIEEKAYRDTWGAGIASYASMLSTRLRLMHQLLSASGSLWVHCDWHMSHHIRQLLDEVFGAQAFTNEVAWHYFGFKRKTARNFPRKHDTLLLYAKTREYTWNIQYRPHRPEYVARFKKDKGGRLFRDDVNPTGGGRRVIYLDEVPGDIVDSVWDDIPPVNPMGSERWDFPTQKPEALLERVIASTSRPGDLVADFFCGSGTTVAVAERLGRRWIAADLGRFAVHTARKRLLSLAGNRPFEVLNLGRYERQFWQAATFGVSGNRDASVSLLEYIAFILKLYGAGPVAGFASLHGQRGKAFVHVGAVDSPVTMHEVADAVEECLGVNASELHVLGWEWEMGLNDTVTGVAKGRGVKLILRQIPREIMEAQVTRKGDITFHELAYLAAEVRPARGARAFRAHLTDFLIPNPDLISDEVRRQIRKWSDFVDYWAVDWDFSNDTFMQGWVTYRTRKDRTLVLDSDPHAYETPGEYSVMIKVIDIFGNDTSGIVKVRVR